MKNNNGKIAIAIVAMFVVALSVVGFTYAYFTATVVGNTKNTSVEVTAGELVINYTRGQEIVAQNVVPGWKSDGKTFYDPKYSVTTKDVNGVMVNTITAVSTDQFGEGEGKLAAAPSITPAAKDGLIEPARFQVENKGTDAAAYKVDLQVTENEIADSSTHLFYYLYESDTEGNFSGDAIKTGNLAGGTQTIELVATDTLSTTGTKKYYQLVLEYKNNEDDNQNASINKNIKAKIVVSGLGQVTGQ